MLYNGKPNSLKRGYLAVCQSEVNPLLINIGFACGSELWRLHEIGWQEIGLNLENLNEINWQKIFNNAFVEDGNDGAKWIWIQIPRNSIFESDERFDLKKLVLEKCTPKTCRRHQHTETQTCC